MGISDITCEVCKWFKAVEYPPLDQTLFLCLKDKEAREIHFLDESCEAFENAKKGIVYNQQSGNGGAANAPTNSESSSI